VSIDVAAVLNHADMDLTLDLDSNSVDIEVEASSDIPVETASISELRYIVYRGIDGHSPRISENGTWIVYDDETKQWVDTGIKVSNSYADIDNKPRINEHELRSGENALVEIGIARSSNSAVDRLFT
jgi:hypothetical protein